MVNITRKIRDKKISAHGLIGTSYVMFKAYEPSGIMGNHSTITHYDDDGWYGDISTRRLPEDIEALPKYSNERVEKVHEWQEKNYMESRKLIFEAYPELNELNPDEIHIWYGQIEVYDEYFCNRMEAIV